MNSDNKTLTYKILIIGESNAGKSSIVTRLTKNKFSDFNIPTIGVDF